MCVCVVLNKRFDRNPCHIDRDIHVMDSPLQPTTLPSFSVGKLVPCGIESMSHKSELCEMKLLIFRKTNVTVAKEAGKEKRI